MVYLCTKFIWQKYVGGCSGQSLHSFETPLPLEASGVQAWTSLRIALRLYLGRLLADTVKFWGTA